MHLPMEGSLLDKQMAEAAKKPQKTGKFAMRGLEERNRENRRTGNSKQSFTL